jgi:hypothetical protein
MSVALSILHTLALAATALALGHDPFRRHAVRFLAVLGATALVAAALALGSERSLLVTHPFPAFEGQSIRTKAFPIESVAAPGQWYGLCAAAFCFGWAAWLGRLVRTRRDVDPFWAPLVLGWSSTALVLALEKAAAPEGLVAPLAFDRGLLPASSCAAVLLAIRCRSVFLTLSWLSLFVSLSRLPIAVFGTLATRHGWGTSLDVHSMRVFANPFMQWPVEVQPASFEQLGWLVWAPQLLILPAIYMLSVGGVAFAVSMFVLHPERD